MLINMTTWRLRLIFAVKKFGEIYVWMLHQSKKFGEIYVWMLHQSKKFSEIYVWMLHQSISPLKSPREAT